MTENKQFGSYEQLDCSDCVNHGGDWNCDHIQCHKGTDTISIAAAIDALDRLEYTPGEWATNGLTMCKDAIKALPSAESEPLTDKEQRIFLAAMGREEEVCKKVDEECRNCREPYEDSLVKTCHEIIRKVKGALWT